MILLPQSSVFPSHITFAIASGSKECHGWEIVKIFPFRRQVYELGHLFWALKKLIFSLSSAPGSSYASESVTWTFLVRRTCLLPAKFTFSSTSLSCHLTWRQLKPESTQFSTAAAGRTPRGMQGRRCRSTGLRAALGLGWGAAQPTWGRGSCATSSLCREGWVILREPPVQKKPLWFWWLRPYCTKKSASGCPSNAWRNNSNPWRSDQLRVLLLRTTDQQWLFWGRV